MPAATTLCHKLPLSGKPLSYGFLPFSLQREEITTKTIMYMEIVAIEKKTFEEMVAKFDRFVHRMDVV